jgi:predicted RNase H-like nuclease
MTVVVGVDASRSPGWVAVTLRDGRLHSMVLHPSLDAVVESGPEAAVFGVDIPIGHEDPLGVRDQGRRQCDRAAREFLGAARQASVFWVPPPGVLEASEQTEAVERCRAKGWIAPSAQLWALRGRLVEARRFARDPRFHEVHPEVSFQEALRQGGKTGHLGHPKTTWPGLVERLELLHAARLRPERSLGGVGRASPDDVLDATIAAWSAWRIANGKARPLPANPPVDPASGRPVAIWV